jgi:hypothetical protein
MSTSAPIVVFLCGAINAGKSTIGKLLAPQLHAELIDGDTIRAGFPDMSLEEAIPVTVKGMASAVKEFVEKGQSVVAMWPLRAEDHQVLISALEGLDSRIVTFALNPSLKAANTNRGTRELTEWEINRNHELYKMGINNPGFAVVLDNTHETPEETLGRIYQYLDVK